MSRHDAGEDDVADDDKVAASRDTGGVADPDADDQGSTTATSETPEFVGRVAGDDVGYAGETGAEARAEEQRSKGIASSSDDAASPDRDGKAGE